ncbi:MAG TPA: amidotransferase 1, exosortase A system-associated [Plasticicumulans sp.]|uniref:XrtA/PEP-CTERM system amidotransferase n=1 Tax=Plasticicumulans sp. TaxID=2307179 RepID=UPI002C3BA922|nr:XrtA/PEP-CTERM system amidotransferase [Plasticicumulans sp.]HMW41542.1 amidotransferase 1, exosortase A system-associated [Plasticicumulans sp.]HNF65879.1 amidotransferase 1, exosortase A system-associated [Plasticicumulans sp.]HNG48470.1 amidotransferase 1, exosortase A system-associated [Plasticicumulans sp.]HNI21700.1 amidotransferase 1, exosortase A system-associated [Plasticicumulans sp.]
MCGIAGIVDLRERRNIEADVLASMNQVQFHRGPDEGGVHIEPGVGLAHRRLSIIDLSSGQQPLWNEDHTVVVVFNGEIYNYQGIAAELQALGHTFRTHSDTEVIVHAWEQWGEACVTRFRGMFAFALWDRNTETLFLARDRLGKKPLHYALLPDGQLIFGSELKILAAHPRFPRALDPLAVEDYFAYGYIPDPRSIYRAALKLPPAHTLCLRRGEPLPAPKSYWDAPFAPLPAMSVEDAGAELIERLREATRIRLMSEVPLGAFLSGGVDSSAVVAMMAGLSDEPVKTCSIAFDDPRFNEAQFAQQVADRFRTEHRVETVDPDDFDLIDRLAWLYDEPYADSSALPTYRVCQLARRSVTVALSGDGGDENLAGYRRYKWHSYEERLRSALPLGVRRPLFGLLGKVYPKADWAPRVLRAKTTFEAMARDTVEGYFHGVSVMSDRMRAPLYSAAFRRELQGYHALEVMRAHAANAPTEDPLSLIQYIDLKTYLPGDILTKVDRASMAHSLEVRVPLLDHELVEWISGLPPDFKLRGGEGKYVFKKALEPVLPHDILYRPKMGFAVPLAAWFRGPLAARLREAVLGATMRACGVFDMDYLATLVGQHQSGRRDHSAALWSLLMFESFLRNAGVGADAGPVWREAA